MAERIRKLSLGRAISVDLVLVNANLRAAGVALLLAAGGCSRQSSALPLDLHTVSQLTPANTAQISYEEVGADIVVTVIDKYGDSHIHKLNLEGATKRDALELLRQKHAELGDRR